MKSDSQNLVETVQMANRGAPTMRWLNLGLNEPRLQTEWENSGMQMPVLLKTPGLKQMKS